METVNMGTECNGLPEQEPVKKKKIDKKTRDRIFIIGMLAIPILQFLIFFVYINIRTFVMSFESVNWLTGSMKYGWQNYERLWREFSFNPLLQHSILNSFYIFLLTDFIILPLSILCGYYIFKGVPGRQFYRVVFFFPSIISIVVLTMVYKFMLNPSFGILNKILMGLGMQEQDIPVWLGEPGIDMLMVCIYNVWAGIGFNMLFLNGAIAGLPQDVFEYSKLEGVGMMRELVCIVVPMIWSTIISLFVMGAAAMFTFFLPAKLLTNGGVDGSSTTIGLYITDLVKGVSADLQWSATLGIFFSLVGIPVIFGFRALLEYVGKKFEE